MLETVAKEVAAAHMKGVQVAIVVGGGNYFRGANAWNGLDRATADYVGYAHALTRHCTLMLHLQAACMAQAKLDVHYAWAYVNHRSQQSCVGPSRIDSLE